MNAALNARYERVPNPHLGRDAHLWSFGTRGMPVLAFPTAGGYAHEWQSHGMVDAIGDLIASGQIRLYCPETNIAECWTHSEDPASQRMARHDAYERFILHTLLPRMHAETGRRDVVSIGASLGAFYAVHMALKHPEAIAHAIGLSGRYQMAPFLEGHHGLDGYYNNPMAYASRLHGHALHRIRRHTRVTLVCGQGNFEGRCLTETVDLARICQDRDIPHHLDLWGHDVSHEFVWWRRQLRYHVLRQLRAREACA